MMTSRQFKAFMAWVSRKIVPLGPDRWAIAGKKKRDGTVTPGYMLHRDPKSRTLHCNCKGFDGASTCKHVEALEKWLVDGDPKPYANVREEPRLTYPQDWTRYNISSKNMEHLLPLMLRSLALQVIPPVRHYSEGRPPVQRADLFICIGMRVKGKTGGRLADSTVRGMFEQSLFVSDRREACAPSHDTISRAMRDTADTPPEHRMLDAFLRALRLCGLAVEEREARFAVDGSEYATHWPAAVRNKQLPEEMDKEKIRAHCVVGVHTKICVAAKITRGNVGESPQFIPLMSSLLGPFRIKSVSADKAYLSEDNLRWCADRGIYASIPAKSNTSKIGEKHTARQARHWPNRTEDEKDIFGKRQLAESFNSKVKRITQEVVRSRTIASAFTEVAASLVVANCDTLARLYIEDPSFDIPFLDERARRALDELRAQVKHAPRISKAPKLPRKIAP